jgi:cytochrome c peroxidase
MSTRLVRWDVRRAAATCAVAAVAAIQSTEPSHGAHRMIDVVRRAPSGVVRIAALGHSPRAGDVAGNRRAIAVLIENAARAGARYIVAPELTAVAATADGCSSARGVAEPIPGPSTAFFGDLSRRFAVWLAVSQLERAAGGDCYVTAVLLGPDGTVRRQARKVLVRGEADAGATAGPFRAVVDSVDADGVRIGMVSADDVSAGVPRLAHRGARMILINGDGRSDDATMAASLSELAREHRTVLGAAGAACELSKACVANVYGATAERRVLPEGTIVIAAAPIRPAWVIPTRPGLPGTVPVPAIDSGSAAIAELGRQLFTDRHLSSTGTVACATCHNPTRAFTNGLPRGVGVHGRLTKRNVPSLLNVAFRPLLQWDGYASAIENFVKYPISSRDEMDFHYLDRAVPYVRQRADYVDAFRSTMHLGTIEFEHIAGALAAYQRTLLSGNSPFDRYMYLGHRSALSPSAVRGHEIFTGKGGCARCHAIGSTSALFTDGAYHDIGVGYEAPTGRYRDIGLGGISTNDFAGQFLTPSLRNVALTAPYMHDGSLATLDDVIDFYERAGGEARRGLPALKLTVPERRDLIAFLEGLTGDQHYDATGRLTGEDGRTTAEGQVRQVIDQFYAAAQRRDWDGAGALMAHDFEINTDGAESYGKKAYIALLKEDDLVVERMALRNLTVEVSSDSRMAWATFHGYFEMTQHGARHDVQTAETLILSRRGDRWEIVRAHASVKTAEGQ